MVIQIMLFEWILNRRTFSIIVIDDVSRSQVSNVLVHNMFATGKTADDNICYPEHVLVQGGALPPEVAPQMAVVCRSPQNVCSTIRISGAAF